MTPSGNSGSPSAALAALLEWYAEAGIDAIVLDTPRDRFAETQAESALRPAARASAAKAAGGPSPLAGTDIAGAEEAGLFEDPGLAAPPDAHARAPAADAGPARGATPAGVSAARIAVPDEIAIADARERARSASTLEELEAALASFEGCNLRVSARSLVFGDGRPDADLMLIGEAPGREEDIAGVPFVGKSGQLLNRMLTAIGVERAGVRVTNTVPWRPPGNRPPTPTETAICLPFIARQIELVAPKILVCLGSPSAKAILQTDEGILRLRGRWQRYGDGLSEGIPALPMLHPAYLLRQPAQKKLAWRDLLLLKQRLSETA